jgi:hypothetical protein
MLKRPADVTSVVRRDAEFGMIGQQASQDGQIGGPDEPSLGVSHFRPRVGE